VSVSISGQTNSNDMHSIYCNLAIAVREFKYTLILQMNPYDQEQQIEETKKKQFISLINFYFYTNYSPLLCKYITLIFQWKKTSGKHLKLLLVIWTM
jgi:hypothetical protein